MLLQLRVDIGTSKRIERLVQEKDKRIGKEERQKDRYRRRIEGQVVRLEEKNRYRSRIHIGEGQEQEKNSAGDVQGTKKEYVQEKNSLEMIGYLQGRMGIGEGQSGKDRVLIEKDGYWRRMVQERIGYQRRMGTGEGWCRRGQGIRERKEQEKDDA